MTKPLTPSQRAVYEVVSRAQRVVSLQEIAERVQRRNRVSTRTIRRLLKKLADEKLLALSRVNGQTVCVPLQKREGR